MSYIKDIEEVISRIPVDTMDFSKERKRGTAPTMASSEFLTNKQQGDWAEELLFNSINQCSRNHVAVRYGKADDIVAGDEGFKEFYEKYQDELDTIGKRPDLLIFKKTDFDSALGYDISRRDGVDDYVRKAIAGIEVRSSAFLHKKYDECKKLAIANATSTALRLRDEILRDYSDLLSEERRRTYLEILNALTTESVHTLQFKRPSWRSSERLCRLSEMLSDLRSQLETVQSQKELSITPKMEDMAVVYKWIQTYNVPHYYFQVFFDTIYGISFKDILTLITSEERDGIDFRIDSDPKNQFKTTVKIYTKSAQIIAGRVDEPEHSSVRAELPKGRLLYYVKFKNGKAYLDIDHLKRLLGIDLSEKF